VQASTSMRCGGKMISRSREPCTNMSTRTGPEPNHRTSTAGRTAPSTFGASIKNLAQHSRRATGQAAADHDTRTEEGKGAMKLPNSATLLAAITSVLALVASCTSPEEFQRESAARCEAVGIKPGTPDFAYCLQRGAGYADFRRSEPGRPPSPGASD
jgi:hypothetical protein